MTPTMHVVGFDVSIARTGWAAITYETGDWVRGGIITTDARLNLLPRLAEIRRQTWDILELFDHGVDVAIEQGISYRSGEVTRKLAMAWATVALSCSDRMGIEPHEVNVSTVKSLAAGNGHAQKSEVVAAAVARWGDETHDPDIADAAWIAEACRLHMHREFDREVAG